MKTVSKQECKLYTATYYYESFDGELKIHSEDSPAIITTYKSGALRSYEYVQNGVRHNTFGPAFIMWTETGSLVTEDYWLWGKNITQYVHKEGITFPLDENDLIMLKCSLDFDK